MKDFVILLVVCAAISVDSKVSITDVEVDSDDDLVHYDVTLKEKDGEKVADFDMNIFKTINGVLFELAISLELGDEYVELWHSKSFDPCGGAPPDEAPIKYFLNQMAKYGSKLNPCPLVKSVRSLRGFKFDDDGMPDSIKNGPSGNIKIEFIGRKKSDGEEFFVKSFFVAKS